MSFLSTAGKSKAPLFFLPVVAFMLIFFGQLVFGSRHLSMTSDEPPHMINGYVALTTGDSWTVPAHGHPPFLNAWSAWPLLLQPERPDPVGVPYWGKNFVKFVRAMWPLLGPIERVAFVTRVPIMLLAVVLMALVYRWACDLFGRWGGVLAVAVMAWDPTLVAHAQLDTTDVGMTLFAFAGLYLVYRLLRRFSWRLLVGVGALLGATMAAKGSGVMLAPVIVAMLGWGYLYETGARWWALLRGQASPSANLRALLRAGVRWLGYAALVVGLGLLFLWATYRFEWRALPGMTWPIPLSSHIRMLQIIFEEKGRLAFLWGMRRQGGWWWYFPFAFAVKTPIPLIVGLGAALVVAARRRWYLLRDEMVLWFFPLFYLVTAMQSELNIGYRHLLPMFPFAYVGLGRLARWLFGSWRSRWQWIVRGSAVGLGAWYILGTLLVYPFPLAYFNELVGGARNGYRYLVDSNVDWGQSFKALKTYMDQARLDWVWLSYYTWIDPAVYGVRYQPLFPYPGMEPVMTRRYDPAPGVYALSATTMQGIMLFDPDLYEWFRHRQPVAQPGYGLLVYQVAPRDPPARWVAQCTVPASPLSPEAIKDGFGRDDLREIYFDCETSWVYPEGGQSAGWYGLFRETWQRRDSFMQERLKLARLSYEQVEYHQEPAFVLFEWKNGTAPVPQSGGKVTAAPSDWAPARAETEGVALTLPVQLNGPMTFLGYQVLSPPVKGVLEVQTVWRVEANSARPLSIMAHLLGPNGAPIAVGDGLGVPVDQWQKGDVIIQRHRLTIPAGTPPGVYWVQTGVYWLDTLERWAVERDGQPVGDRLLLSSVAVK
jgi:hypothetical protein